MSNYQRRLRAARDGAAPAPTATTRKAARDAAAGSGSTYQRSLARAQAGLEPAPEAKPSKALGDALQRAKKAIGGLALGAAISQASAASKALAANSASATAPWVLEDFADVMPAKGYVIARASLDVASKALAAPPPRRRKDPQPLGLGSSARSIGWYHALHDFEVAGKSVRKGTSVLYVACADDAAWAAVKARAKGA